MTPGKFDFDLYRGDTYAWRFTLWDDEEKTIPVDLTDATVKAEIREKPAGSTILELSSLIVLPNSVDVTMTPDMYVGCPIKGVWDLQLTFPGDKVLTPIGGSVNVTIDVTDSLPVVQTRRTGTSRRRD